MPQKRKTENVKAGRAGKARRERRPPVPSNASMYYTPASATPLANTALFRPIEKMEEGQWNASKASLGGFPPASESKQFKLSVVIPSYNEEKHIAEALTHLRRVQPGLEIILGDGHSPDRTAEMARPFVDKIVFETKRSIGAGRNVGAKAATGDILLFNDADTRVPREFFEKVQEVFRDPKVVGFGCRILPEDPTPFQEWMFNIFNLMIWLSVAIGRPTLSGPICAYRREPFVSIGGFDEEMKASEDQDLCLRIAKLGRVVYDNRIIAYSSKRRLLKFGWIGLFKDWGRTTIDFLLGRKTKHYELVRDVG